MIPMIFSEVRVTGVADTPLLLLREARGERYLPIWISAAAANGILSALEDAPDEQPDTHDFVMAVLAAVDVVISEVRVLDVIEGVYSAVAVVGGQTVPCRASDGVAMALRCGAALLVAESVLDRAGVQAVPAAHEEAGADAQLEQFKAFLDTINPEDFDASGPPPEQP